MITREGGRGKGKGDEVDLSSWIGTGLGILAVGLGQWLSGGSLGQLIQFAALFVVIGGTLAATLLAHSASDILQALRALPLVYKESRPDDSPLIEEIIRLAVLARKEGVLALEPERAGIHDPLLRKSIKYVIDGFDPGAVREILEAEIRRSEDQEARAAQVFESAGSYAPTIGTLGAVLGLIQVMARLSDPTKIGEGIAVAFVATLYGVVLANLLLLPWAAKLKRRIEARLVSREIVKAGVLGILEGLNPHFLQERLQVFRGPS